MQNMTCVYTICISKKLYSVAFSSLISNASQKRISKIDERAIRFDFPERQVFDAVKMLFDDETLFEKVIREYISMFERTDVAELV